MLHLLPAKGVRCVYFIVSQGQIVYVGQTANIRRRVSQHADKRPERIFILSCGDAFATERRMITACRPALNKDLSETLPFPVITAKDLDRWGLPYVQLEQKGECVRIVGIGKATA